MRSSTPRAGDVSCSVAIDARASHVLIGGLRPITVLPPGDCCEKPRDAAVTACDTRRSSVRKTNLTLARD